MPAIFALVQFETMHLIPSYDSAPQALERLARVECATSPNNWSDGVEEIHRETFWGREAQARGYPEL
jgi:hypothetical protein